MKKSIVALIGIIVLGFLGCANNASELSLSETPTNAGVTPTPTLTIKPQPTNGTKTQEPRTEMKTYISDAIILTDNLQGLELPEKLPIFANTTISLSCEDIASALKNSGWQNHVVSAIDDDGYLITCETKASPSFTKESYEFIANSFLEDSGLLYVLTQNELDYKLTIDGESNQYVATVFLYKDSVPTGSFIRMNFEDSKVCAECMIHLFKSDTVTHATAIPFEEAIKHAFVMDENFKVATDDKFTVTSYYLQYVDGLPFYRFNAGSNKTRTMLSGYALAVSYEEIAEHSALAYAFENLGS